MPTPHRITQQDVADVAKVNRTTVSLALSGNPIIPERTRDRIKRIAERLGYRPDPMLSALAAYRHGRRPSEFHGTLAWLAHTTDQHGWRRVASFAAYYEAACRQAERRGFRVDVVDLADYGNSWKRAAAVMRARGIRGILLCPQPNPETNLEHFPWDEFSVVTFGFSVTRPTLNSVAPSQFRAAFRATCEMFNLGYRRIGFFFPKDHDQRTDHNYLGGYLSARELQKGAARIPPLFYDHNTPIGAWLNRHRLDGILIGSPSSLPYLRANGLGEHSEIGLASACLAKQDGFLAGVCDANEELGVAALDLLVAMMNRGERGVPCAPHRLVVEGIWSPGVSLKARSQEGMFESVSVSVGE